MRAYKGTPVAANAFLAFPDRDIICHTALFKTGCINRHNAVCIFGKYADRKRVALCTVHGDQDIPDKFRQILINRFILIIQLSPLFRNLNSDSICQAAFNCGQIHIYNLLAFS